MSLDNDKQARIDKILALFDGEEEEVSGPPERLPLLSLPEEEIKKIDEGVDRTNRKARRVS